MKTELEIVNISVLNVGHARTQHHWGGTDISSPFARLYYVKEGHAHMSLPSGEVELHPGHMYLVPSYMPHSYLCEPGFDFYYMFVYERYGDQTDFFDIYSFPFEVEANEAIDLLFTNYCSLYPQLSLPFASAEDFINHIGYRDYAKRYSEMDRYEKMQLQGLVWIITSYFMKHAYKRIEETDERIIKVCRFVKENISKDISPEHLSDIACVTRSHLAKLFHKSFGISPLQYIIRQKIQYAQHLLLTTDMSVKAIAQSTAFQDVSYFIRLFKKNIGFTPQDYREALKY